MRPKDPLYRSVNTRTHGVRHDRGGDFRHERYKRDADDAGRAPMHGKKRRGRDYTPLFRFLLSREGQPWDQVFGEAKGRLDDTAPVFWMVALHPQDRQGIVRIGESSWFSGMHVDDEGVLRRVDPTLDARDMQPDCGCCTHTFNGVRFGEAG